MNVDVAGCESEYSLSVIIKFNLKNKETKLTTCYMSPLHWEKRSDDDMFFTRKKNTFTYDVTCKTAKLCHQSKSGMLEIQSITAARAKISFMGNVCRIRQLGAKG